MSLTPYQIQVFERMDDVPRNAWDRLTSPNFPFSDHAYLHALEVCGAVGGGSGWRPCYLTVWRDRQLEGATVLYTKDNSYGEYIFDWAWAEAYHQHGLQYFPKLTSAVPFTPATGPKLLFSAQADRKEVGSRLICSAREMMERHGHSSLHYLFLTPEELPFFEAEGFLIRHSFQYHWKNRDYADFDHFLATLKPRKRKQIIREREQLQAENLKIKILTGVELQPEHAALFYQFYRSTIEKMGAIEYLNEEFFKTVFATMHDDVVLILACDQTTAIAGALFYKKGTSLYGRYWGAIKEVRNLHFELCYYQPLQWAIERKMRLFEAGAQGEHKISRGFLPELTFSAHWIGHPAFREAIGRFIAQERVDISRHLGEMKSHDPFQL